jgi:hypothetical protein
MKKAFPILGILTAIFLSYALYLALVVAPREQTMGDVQRIFYYHVPSAWTAFLLFFINFLASVQYLVRRNPSTDKVANWILITVAVVTCIASVVIAVVPSLKEAMPKDVQPSSIGTTGPSHRGGVLPDPQLLQRRSRRLARGHDRRSRRGLLHGGADNRASLGAAGLGHLVDVGRTPDLDTRAVADLCELPDPEAIFFKRPDPSDGGGAGRLRRA